MLFCACRAKYDAVEVTVHTTLPLPYLNKKVPYKYSIQYPNGSNYLEYIRDLPVKDDCNRCLELGNQKKGIVSNCSYRYLSIHNYYCIVENFDRGKVNNFGNLRVGFIN